MSFILYAHMIAHDLDCWLIGNDKPVDNNLYFGATIFIEGDENEVYKVYREWLD